MTNRPKIPTPSDLRWEELSSAAQKRLDWHRDRFGKDSRLLFSRDEGAALLNWGNYFHRKTQPQDASDAQAMGIIRQAASLLKPASMSAADLSSVIQEWLNASPATEWGDFEWALNSALHPEGPASANGAQPG